MKDRELCCLGNRVITPAFIIIICIPVILLVVSLIGGLLVIAYEDQLCARDLNNPFVNADYPNWSAVELVNEKNIMIPDKWHITATESVTVIADEYGKNIAKGGKLVQDENASYQYEKLLGELFEQPASITAITQLGNIRTSEWGTLTVDVDHGTAEYDYILLSQSDYCDMLFVFEPTAKETHSNLISILEAIVFSYVWK